MYSLNLSKIQEKCLNFKSFVDMVHFHSSKWAQILALGRFLNTLHSAASYQFQGAWFSLSKLILHLFPHLIKRVFLNIQKTFSSCLFSIQIIGVEKIFPFHYVCQKNTWFKKNIFIKRFKHIHDSTRHKIILNDTNDIFVTSISYYHYKNHIFQDNILKRWCRIKKTFNFEPHISIFFWKKFKEI